LMIKAEELIKEAGFHIGKAHCAIESKPPVSWDKGRASIYILRTAFGVDWSDRIRIIYVGDDVTDEDAMETLKGMAFSFRVVNSDLTQTAANMRLPSTDSVVCLLKWVEKHMSERNPKSRNGGRFSPKLNHIPATTSSQVHIPDNL